MNKLNKVIIVLFKIAEVFCWVGSALSAAVIAVLAFGQTQLLRFLTDATPESAQLTTGGFTMEVIRSGEAFTPGAMILFFITVLLSLLLSAMIARNICLIFKTTEGKTKFSQGKTPFQRDNIRMIREIGIFLIAIPAVELIMSILAELIIGGNLIDTSVNFTGVATGLVVLALSRYFSYGMQLQEEVDGLL